MGAWHESMDWEGCWGKGWAGQKCLSSTHWDVLAPDSQEEDPQAWFWREVAVKWHRLAAETQR